MESNKFPFGKQDFEYFNGYKEIRPLCIYFPEMCIYKRYSDQSKCIYFMIKDEKRLNKYITIQEKVRNIIKKKFNSEHVSNKKIY